MHLATLPVSDVSPPRIPQPRFVTIDDEGQERQTIRIPDEVAADLRAGRASAHTVFPPAPEPYRCIGVMIYDVWPDSPREAGFGYSAPHGYFPGRPTLLQVLVTAVAPDR